MRRFVLGWKLTVILFLAFGLHLGVMAGEALARANTGGTVDWGVSGTWATGYDGEIVANTTVVYNNPNNTLYDPLYTTAPFIHVGLISTSPKGSGPGTLYVTAGSLTTTGEITVGREYNGLVGEWGYLYVQGGTLTGTSLSQQNSDDRDTAGVVNVSSGMLKITGSSTLGSRPWTYLRLSGGTLDSFVNASVHTFEGSGAVSNLTGTLTLDTPASTRFDGTIGGTGGLVKNNVGTIALTGDSTYTGTTTLNRGGFRVTFGAGSPTSDVLGNAGLIMSSGALDLHGRYDTTNSQAFAGLTLNPGQASIRLNQRGGHQRGHERLAGRDHPQRGRHSGLHQARRRRH